MFGVPLSEFTGIISHDTEEDREFLSKYHFYWPLDVKKFFYKIKEHEIITSYVQLW